MFKIGVTGGIGSGKTTICNLFRQHGIATIDADQLGHQLTAAGGQAITAISESFGSQVINSSGALDRNKMREIVFIDPSARQRLEAILHPLIRQQSDEAVARSAGPYVLLGIPLLIEGLKKQAQLGLSSINRVDRVLVIDCLPSEQLQRVQQRNKLSEAAVQAIMQAQVSRQERLRWADDVILNFDGQVDCKEQVQRLHDLYLRLAQSIK